MLYRIIVKTPDNSCYYLITEKENIDIDAPINLDEDLEFSSNPNISQIYTYTTEELAQNAINSLPYPYSDKSSILSIEDANSPVPKSIYYRIIKKFPNSRSFLWANTDKTFSNEITPNTIANFFSESEALEFQQTLNGWDDSISRVVLVYDYGEPFYDFDVFILKTKEIHKFRAS